MALNQNDANVITAAIPAVVEIVKMFHAHANPEAAPLTPEQALALLQQAVADSLKKDDAISRQVASAADLGMHAGSTGE